MLGLLVALPHFQRKKRTPSMHSQPGGKHDISRFTWELCSQAYSVSGSPDPFFPAADTVVTAKHILGSIIGSAYASSRLQPPTASCLFMLSQSFTCVLNIEVGQQCYPLRIYFGELIITDNWASGLRFLKFWTWFQTWSFTVHRDILVILAQFICEPHAQKTG